MMSKFDEELATRLDAIRQRGLYRELRRINSPQLPHTQVDSKTLLNFSSNDYLGLANHPLLKEAATRGIERYGAGSGASRLICGSLAPHHELEQAIAAFEQRSRTEFDWLTVHIRGPEWPPIPPTLGSAPA